MTSPALPLPNRSRSPSTSKLNSPAPLASPSVHDKSSVVLESQHELANAERENQRPLEVEEGKEMDDIIMQDETQAQGQGENGGGKVNGVSADDLSSFDDGSAFAPLPVYSPMLLGMSAQLAKAAPHDNPFSHVFKSFVNEDKNINRYDGINSSNEWTLRAHACTFIAKLGKSNKRSTTQLQSQNNT